MRTSVFIAAIGTAAVLGGAVGGAAMKLAIGHDDGKEPIAESAVELALAIEKKLDKNQALESARIDLLGQETLPTHWWCIHGDGECYRTSKECDERPGRIDTCKPIRAAYCNASACWGTLDACEYGQRLLNQRGRCVGVE